MTNERFSWKKFFKENKNIGYTVLAKRNRIWENVNKLPHFFFSHYSKYLERHYENFYEEILLP